MNCEICGKPMTGFSTVLIDGTQFDVCENCSSLGKKLEVTNEKKDFLQAKKPFIKPKRKFVQGTGPELNSNTLIEGFGKKIMQARQRKNLTLKDLAMKLYEKESVIQRIEAEKFTPSDKTIKKIENELEIQLRE